MYDDRRRESLPGTRGVKQQYSGIDGVQNRPQVRHEERQRFGCSKRRRRINNDDGECSTDLQRLLGYLTYKCRCTDEGGWYLKRSDLYFCRLFETEADDRERNGRRVWLEPYFSRGRINVKHTGHGVRDRQIEQIGWTNCRRRIDRGNLQESAIRKVLARNGHLYGTWCEQCGRPRYTLNQYGGAGEEARTGDGGCESRISGEQRLRQSAKACQDRSRSTNRERSRRRRNAASRTIVSYG